MSTSKESAPVTSEMSTTEWLLLYAYTKRSSTEDSALTCQQHIYTQNEVFTFEISATEMSATEISTAELPLLGNSQNVLNLSP